MSSKTDINDDGTDTINDIINILTSKSPPLINFSYFTVISTDKLFEHHISNYKIIINIQKCSFAELENILKIENDQYINACLVQASINIDSLLEKIKKIYYSQNNDFDYLIEMFKRMKFLYPEFATRKYVTDSVYNNFDDYTDDILKENNAKILNNENLLHSKLSDITKIPHLIVIFIDDVNNGIFFINEEEEEKEEKEKEEKEEKEKDSQEKKDSEEKYKVYNYIYQIIDYIFNSTFEYEYPNSNFEKMVSEIINNIKSLHILIDNCKKNEQCNKINIKDIKDKIQNINNYNTEIYQIVFENSKIRALFSKKDNYSLKTCIYANVVLICVIYFVLIKFCKNEDKKTIIEEYYNGILTRNESFKEVVNEIKNKINDWNFKRINKEEERKKDKEELEAEYKKNINLLKKSTQKSLFPKLRKKIIGLLEKINSTNVLKVEKIQMLKKLPSVKNVSMPSVKNDSMPSVKNDSMPSVKNDSMPSVENDSENNHLSTSRSTEKNSTIKKRHLSNLPYIPGSTRKHKP
jgi:uncharacterized protein YqgV (UPF0045/DUF77 family)